MSTPDIELDNGDEATLLEDVEIVAYMHQPSNGSPPYLVVEIDGDVSRHAYFGRLYVNDALVADSVEED